MRERSLALLVEGANTSPQLVMSAVLNASSVSEPLLVMLVGPNMHNMPKDPNEPKAQYPQSYCGVEYTAICRDWLRATGGEPVEGSRISRLFDLACELRAICDNNPEWVAQVLPGYGLPQTELHSIAVSACKNDIRRMSIRLRNIVRRLNPEAVTDGQTSAAAQFHAAKKELCMQLARLAPKLPEAMRVTMRCLPEEKQWNAVAAVMPAAMSYASQMRPRYIDGMEQYLGAMTLVIGEQASGKSAVMRLTNVWLEQMRADDEVAWATEREWRTKCRARKANEKAPDDPKVVISVVPAQISNTALLRRLVCNQGRTMVMVEEELDTLLKSNRSGAWAEKNDIFRKAFDGAEAGQLYNSDQSENAIAAVRLNFTMLGTPRSLHKFFKSDNIENGLSSRVVLATMPSNEYGRMEKRHELTPEEHAAIMEGVNRLRSFVGTVDTPRINRTITQWVEEKRVEAMKDDDRVKDVYRKRAAVIAWRYAQVMAILSDGHKETRAILDFTRLIAELVLLEQSNAFGADLLRDYEMAAQADGQRQTKNAKVFDNLEEEFTRADLQRLKPSATSTTITSMVHRWVKEHRVEKTGDNSWRKLPDAAGVKKAKPTKTAE